MMKKIDIGQNAKVKIQWNVHQSNYSRELENSMIALMAKKYGIPAKNIIIEANYITSDGESGVLSTETVQSIHDPKFQQELMKQFIANNDIKDVDFEEILKIDSQINSLIDYDIYDKGKKYTIKWVKWSNFLSYGPDNFFDFTTLNGLILLNGEPANKSGKSTFAYDLLHFLLFGKTNTNKAKNLGELFNNYLPETRTINVEGCINIDGDDFIIKRTLTRPQQGKKTKTVTNKVEYYKVNENGDEEILPEDNKQEASTTATSKIIKEALGNESDFDLIISANAKDLDNIISLTETEKGRLLSRWIGLSVIEDKDVKAREKWNREISVGRFSDMYNQTQLESDIESLTEMNNGNAIEIDTLKNNINGYDETIKRNQEEKDLLLSAKQVIDNSLLKVDATTLQATIDNLIESGKRKNSEVVMLEGQLSEFGEISFSEDDYKAMKRENELLIANMAEVRMTINNLKTTNKALESAEVCPTCHRKLDGVDNSKQIEENIIKIQNLTNSGIEMKKRSDELSSEMAKIEELRVKMSKKSQVELKIAALKTDIANKRVEYKEKLQLLNEIQKNKEAITKNSEIDASINVITTNINHAENLKRTAITSINSIEREIVRNNENIALKKSYLLKIAEERKTERYWKLYLQMIGKDGISKMVLRNTLPIINSELNRLLGDVTDFRVEVVMNEKNDVDFLLIRNDTVTRLSAASGLEKTQSALALRVVLGKMSKLSRPPFILLDEVLGTVAKENYDDMKRLYDKISEYFSFILHITHISDITDWHDSIVTVKKVDNISSIK
jgi:DNA repair exonuclease SbcCD ATPase subunit